ncbi:hypothetical protein SKAU_G00241290 [Synaphobranchus kaupii]|uniref:Tc1-like transposase DDE domain-containing protein n=1 Tax=Synaphobranchus kaupii TaxID=118154 RepID=A0A9Q1F7R0_SYNKA|nr:hypothetical protein SKAU_G00241290 [Synaphobranchus kaupii]
MELEANQAQHEGIYVDEAGFNLAKTRWRRRNVIGKRTTVDVPGQRGANITMCAAISNAGLVLQKCQIGPYNTERLLLFLDDLHQQLVPEAERDQVGGNMRTFVIAWDNVAFHQSHASPSQNAFPFSLPLLAFPQPHRGIVFCLEVESVRSSAT